jgi:hypothetical protein
MSSGRADLSPPVVAPTTGKTIPTDGKTDLVAPQRELGQHTVTYKDLGVQNLRKFETF